MLAGSVHNYLMNHCFLSKIITVHFENFSTYKRSITIYNLTLDFFVIKGQCAALFRISWNAKKASRYELVNLELTRG